MTLQEWLDENVGKYGRQETCLRLGQKFMVEMGIKSTWPALFYEMNEQKAVAMIVKWCEDMQYLDAPLPVHNSLIKEQK